MQFARHLSIFASLGAMALSVSAQADPIAAQDMLVSSSPAADSAQRDGISAIALNFAEPAKLISVTLYLPDDSEISVYPSDDDIDAAVTKGKTFNFKLATPVSAAGQYKISYLLTPESFKSLNGFIDFEVPEAEQSEAE